MIDAAALDERGVTTVDLLDAATLEELRRRFDDLGVDPADPYWASSVHGDRPTAIAVDRALDAVLAPRIAEVLPGHVSFLAAFITKGTGGGRVGLHPDWTYVDERHHRARIFWFPLFDTGRTEGTMVVVPASHRTLRGLRGSGAFASAVERVEDALWADAVEDVPLRAGEAVVWDAAVLHGSWPNHSGSPRPAAVIGMVPAAAPMVHFHLEPNGPLEGFAIDRGYYTVQAYASRPSGFDAVEPWEGPLVPYETVEQVVGPIQGTVDHR